MKFIGADVSLYGLFLASGNCKSFVCRETWFWSIFQCGVQHHVSEKICVLFPSKLITDFRTPLAQRGKIITRAFPVKCPRVQFFAAKFGNLCTNVACVRLHF